MDKMIFEMPAMGDILSRLAIIEQKLDEIISGNTTNGHLLNTKEAAKSLGISVRNLQDKRKRREIGYIQHGDIVRFRLEDIKQFLDAHHINIRNMKGHSS